VEFTGGEFTPDAVVDGSVESVDVWLVGVIVEDVVEPVVDAALELVVGETVVVGSVVGALVVDGA